METFFLFFSLAAAFSFRKLHCIAVDLINCALLKITCKRLELFKQSLCVLSLINSVHVEDMRIKSRF